MRKLIAVVVVSAGMAAMGEVHEPLTNGLSCHVVTNDTWYGFERRVFEFQGREAWIVEPSAFPAEGTPWTWTIQWAEAFVDRVVGRLHRFDDAADDLARAGRRGTRTGR